MEALIRSFLNVNYGDGYGYGSGSGDGSGSGSGSGYGYDSGDGYGYDSGYGSGDGSGSGSGYGYCSGYGSGDGSGDGSGYGYGIKSFCGKNVYNIDGVQTLLFSIKGNMSKGAILNFDFTTTDCFVVKNGRHFAHGKTLKEAMSALDSKIGRHNGYY